jgi:hypothetical protein
MCGVLEVAQLVRQHGLDLAGRQFGCSRVSKNTTRLAAPKPVK